MEIDRRALFQSLGGAAAVALMTPDQKADALEHYMEEQLDAAADEPEYPDGRRAGGEERRSRSTLPQRGRRTLQTGA